MVTTIKNAVKECVVIVLYQLRNGGPLGLIEACSNSATQHISWILSGIQRAAQTVLDVYLKRTCPHVTSASSTLGVLNDYVL